MKKIVSLLLVVCVVLSSFVLCTTVSAETAASNIIVLNAEKEQCVERVILDGSDVYASAEFIDRYTSYRVIEYQNAVRFTRGKKYINASYQGEVTVNNIATDYNLGEVKQNDGKYYYSLAHVLPIIGCYASVDGGKLIISNDSVSVWELFNKFNVNDVKFDLKNEYAKTTDASGQLVNGSSLQKLNYLSNGFGNMWSYAVGSDFVSTFADYDALYDVFVDMMNDYDALYDTAKYLKENNQAMSVYSALEISSNDVISGVTGGKSEFVKAYLQSNADRLEIIEQFVENSKNSEKQSVKAAQDVAEMFSSLPDISSKLVSNSKKEKIYKSVALSNSPEKSAKASFKDEMSKLSTYIVLSESARGRYTYLEDLCGTQGVSENETRLMAIQYVYFAKKCFETMQMYFDRNDQQDIVKQYASKIELCNYWLSAFTAAGTESTYDSFGSKYSYKDFEDIFAQVKTTDQKIDDNESLSGQKETASEMLEIFRSSCAQFNNSKLIYHGDAATKGQIGAIIECIMANGSYFGLSSSKLEVVRSDEIQFTKVFDAVSNKYKELDVERYPSEQICQLLKERFNIKLVLNAYDVYGGIYYEKGYFYNYYGAYNISESSYEYTFKVSKIEKLGSDKYLVKFSSSQTNTVNDRTNKVNGYAVMDEEMKSVFEYDETTSKIPKSRKKLYE